MRAAQDAGVVHAGQFDIVHVGGGAGDEAGVFFADALADHYMLVTGAAAEVTFQAMADFVLAWGAGFAPANWRDAMIMPGVTRGRAVLGGGKGGKQIFFYVQSQ